MLTQRVLKCLKIKLCVDSRELLAVQQLGFAHLGNHRVSPGRTRGWCSPWGTAEQVGLSPPAALLHQVMSETKAKQFCRVHADFTR